MLCCLFIAGAMKGLRDAITVLDSQPGEVFLAVRQDCDR